MSVTVWGATLEGADATAVQVEVDLLRRLPRLTIVGLAAHAVKESAERVRSAIQSAGLEFPRQRIVVNLAPADVRKEGTGLDLPLALGILAAADLVPAERLAGALAVGELSLSGQLRPVRGALSVAMLGRRLGSTVLLPSAIAPQAALASGVDVRGFDDLAQLVAWLRGEVDVPPAQPAPPTERIDAIDFADVRGQPLARRALEIAAAGAHHVLLVGPPGCGKSMLAQRLPTILPPMTADEALEVTRVHSAAGLLGANAHVVAHRPFRAPHHSVSAAGMIGDRTLRPGEVHLSHHGVLFLDEAAEFPRHVLEVLRQPLEDGMVRITRAAGTLELPARLTLVLATNACPCGQKGGLRPCVCPDGDVQRYMRRLSGPVLDRVDLRVDLAPIPGRDLLRGPPGESSARVRDRVIAARDRQLARRQAGPNGQLDAATVREVAHLSPSASNVLERGADAHALSARATTRVIKVARTLADLDDSTPVTPDHIVEALSFRGVPEAA